MGEQRETPVITDRGFDASAYHRPDTPDEAKDTASGMTAREARELAGSLAASGIPCFPIALKRDPAGGKVKKRPLTPNGHHDATTDPDRLEDLFRRHVKYGPGEWPGVGAYPGPAGFLVIDVDDLGALQRLEAAHGLIPGRRVRTVSGGLHIWMRLPEGVEVGQTSPWAGIDIRSGRGWVVAPGTRSPWGGWATEGGRIAPAPDWMVTDILEHEKAPREIPEEAAPGDRHETLVSLAASLWARGLTRPAVLAGIRGYNQECCKPPKPDEELLAIVEWVVAQEGGPVASVTVGGSDPEGVHLVRASSVTPESVEYLDEGLIPLRVVTLVTGLDGVGKSTILYTKAARATRGTLPGAMHGQPVDVVIASSEDHPATVIVPRLIAAGADLDRCHVVKVRRQGIEGEIVLPDDLEEMSHAVAEVSARLLVVDPLVAYMPLQVDSHKAQHVRSVMAPLARLAEDERLAVAAVVHFNGSPSTDVRSRISGSKALRDAARSVLVCGEDPEDETRFVLAQDKFSFGPKPSVGRAYRIEPAEIEHQGEKYVTSRVVWLGEVPISARSMLAGPADTEERTDREIAKEIILDALAEADHRWEGDLLKLTKAEGVGDRTARRARDELRKQGLIDRRKTGPHWWWTLKINLSTSRGQVEGGQVEKHALTGGFTSETVQLVQPLESGQVGQDDGFECHVCSDPAAAYTPTGEPVCDPCNTASMSNLFGEAS